jgi:putative SOS response-associated peptidase YedK
MCTEYEQHICYAEYCKVMQDLALGIPIQQTESDLAQNGRIKIGDMAPVMRSVGDNVVGLTQMRFGLPPVRKHGPVFNVRSQGKSFSDCHRCLVPATAFFESTEKERQKKHRFELIDAPLMAIAAIWRSGRKSRTLSFAMLTTRPGPDVEPFNNRQVVVLRQKDWKAWLDLEKAANELLQPLPGGSLKVENASKCGPIDRR